MIREGLQGTDVAGSYWLCNNQPKAKWLNINLTRVFVSRQVEIRTGIRAGLISVPMRRTGVRRLPARVLEGTGLHVVQHPAG